MSSISKKKSRRNGSNKSTHDAREEMEEHRVEHWAMDIRDRDAGSTQSNLNTNPDVDQAGTLNTISCKSSTVMCDD